MSPERTAGFPGCVANRRFRLVTELGVSGIEKEEEAGADGACGCVDSPHQATRARGERRRGQMFLRPEDFRGKRQGQGPHG